MKKQHLVGVLCLFIILVFNAGNVGAQEGVNKYLRYDATLTVQQNSGITVEEIHQAALVNGATVYRAVIPTDKLETISNIQVLEVNPDGGQRGYVQADTQEPFTFQVLNGEDTQTIILHFPPNSVASTTFVLRYFVTGGVRFYDTGDKLDWRPFGTSAPANIDSSTTTINLPDGFSQEQLTQSSSGVSTEKFTPEANRAIFKATSVSSGDDLEISLGFPHGVIQGTPPSWQQTQDMLDQWTPILVWGSVILALLILLLGPLAVYGWWYMSIRVAPDPAKVKKVPKYVKTPPTKLSPAAAGVLLSGKSEPRHIMATLLDLAARGALNVYPEAEEDNESFMPEEASDKKEPTFNLYGVDQEKAVRSYEATLYAKIFGYQSARTRNLADVRQTVYMGIPEMKGQIDAEIAKAGYLSDNADTLKRQYAAFGGAAILFSIVLALFSALIFSQFTYLVVCPCLSFVVVDTVFIFAGFAAPKRTKKGATVAAGWEAFERYLKELDTKEAAKTRPRFARLLPYATAFGLEKEFIQKYTKAKTPVPKWWSIPAKKLPNVGHEDAHAWVSAGDMSAGAQQPQAEQAKPKGGIRRLGDFEDNAGQGNLLKDIQPEFMAFLNASRDVFSKSPPIDDEEEFDFEALG